MTSGARFFVKRKLHKKCGVFFSVQKVADFFNTLKNSRSNDREFWFLYHNGEGAAASGYGIDAHRAAVQLGYFLYKR